MTVVVCDDDKLVQVVEILLSGDGDAEHKAQQRPHEQNLDQNAQRRYHPNTGSSQKYRM